MTRRFGDNPDGWRAVLRYALTPTGGIVCCVIAALIFALAIMRALAWLEVL